MMFVSTQLISFETKQNDVRFHSKDMPTVSNTTGCRKRHATSQRSIRLDRRPGGGNPVCVSGDRTGGLHDYGLYDCHGHPSTGDPDYHDMPVLSGGGRREIPRPYVHAYPGDPSAIHPRRETRDQWKQRVYLRNTEGQQRQRKR